MLVQTFSALALSMSLAANATAPDDENEQVQTRSLEPTASELAEFQLTPEREYFDTGKSPAFRASGVGMFVASAADVLTTEHGLARGLSEGNPAASQRGLRIATHVVGPAAVYYATERLERAGKTQTAIFLRISLMAAYSYAAIHNARLIGATP